ncbi:MAG TPA: DUF4290 domain-containing protein [Balneolaceae bacterium]|nr:DUF4290 domain-containing protein [Balneolaceae bacterium]
MFVEQHKPKDYDCGYNVDLMISALRRIKDKDERLKYAERAVGLIKQSHPSWLDENGESKAAWDRFYELADYDPEEYGIVSPFKKQDEN